MRLPAFVGLLAYVALARAGPATRRQTSSPLPIVDLGYAVHQATVNETGGYYNFSNIRYAQAPINELRFSAPVPPSGRNATVNDGSFAPSCPQSFPYWLEVEAQAAAGANVSTLAASYASILASLNASTLIPPGPTETEDCLFLDVFAPEQIFNSALAKKHRRGTGDCGGQPSTGAPVLVWIYGGGFTIGTKSSYGSPAGLIAQSQENGGEGIIFVAMNYRLGLFGWLSGPTFQEGATANAGLYDQQLALEWIQQNIHLFGGDPDRVTVMGESAGGSSVMHQITAYGGAKGKVPFQQAIAQSAAFWPTPSQAFQETLFDMVLGYASMVSNASITSLAQLRALPSSTLQTINALAVGKSEYGTFTFGPVVDGSFTPALPGLLLLHGQYDSSLSLMVGHNLKEAELFTSPFVTNDTTFGTFVASSVPGAPAATVDYIQNTLYPPISNSNDAYSNQSARTNLYVAEMNFICNSHFLSSAFEQRAYAYLFAEPPAVHGQDIAYTFFDGDTSSSAQGPPPTAPAAYRFQDYLVAFTMTGNPNGNGRPGIPLYGSQNLVMEIDPAMDGKVDTDNAANDRCAWWQKALYA